VPRLLCATQEYLDKNGTPKHPHDLVSHNGLFYQLQDITHDVWDFSQHGATFKIKMKGNRVSNDGDLVRRWCVAGKGLAVKSGLDMSNDLLSGNVISLMPEFRPTATELWLIFPSRQSITPAARLLRDMLKEKCTGILKKLIEKGIVDDSILT
jgi:DNA-binding transcriptional LysR family regulator